MNNPTVNVAETCQEAEQKYYSLHDWCVNPILTVRKLFGRLREELDQYRTLPFSWQREEARIAIYLFVCAIACTVDDYLSWRPWVLTPLGDDFPQLGLVIPLIQGIFNLPYALVSSSRRRAVRRWQEGWPDYIDRVCNCLLRDSEPSLAEIAELETHLATLQTHPLPDDLLRRRMKMNEGYRCQDLTHHDVLFLVDRFIERHPSRDTKIVIVGPRTAGAYFAPIAKAYLVKQGYRNVSWLTIRPKRVISRTETQVFRHLVADGAHVILSDDYSNTGRTFRLLQKWVTGVGVAPRNITILAPLHPTQPDVKLSQSPETETIVLPHRDLHKQRLLEPHAIEELLREYYGGDECEDVTIHPNPEVDNINAGLRDHYRDGFQVRLKQVYEIDIHHRDRLPVRKRVFAKSVGWGWLGYHAYLAGTRLKGFVPELIGLRNGFLFTEWVDGDSGRPEGMTADRATMLASYVSRRAKALPLSEDPRAQAPDMGWGWLEILRLLRKVYGAYLGYLKNHALMKHLKNHISPFPTLVDGRMRPDEWVVTENGSVKVDFEHHNFGAPQLDIVDPAYDLAGASFEYHLSDAGEEIMLRKYLMDTGDTSLAGRLLLYKLLYATIAKRHTLEQLQRDPHNGTHASLNQRYLWCWNFLTFSMNRFSAGLIRQNGRQIEQGPLMFIDIDGVLDTEILGFPHTTTNGLYAVALLRTNGFTLVPNTGRSIEHVRNYCQTYGFSAGVAEYGSVIFDAVQSSETPLIDGDVAEQLSRCREALKAYPGVCLDNGYRYSVRAYRFSAVGTVGLGAQEAIEFLEVNHLDKLKCITRGPDTYFVEKATSKGSAISPVQELLRLQGSRIVAIGDSDEDIPMLERVDSAFAPHNCTAGIRALASRKRCRVVSGARQAGLLQTARILIGEGNAPGRDALLDEGGEETIQRLLFTLMTIADNSRTRRLVSLFNQKDL